MATHAANGRVNQCPIHFQRLEFLRLCVSLSNSELVTVFCQEAAFACLSALRPQAKCVSRAMKYDDSPMVEGVFHRRLCVRAQGSWWLCLFNSYYDVQVASVC